MKRTLAVVVHVLGVAAFAYPFFLPGARAGDATAHATTAPVIFSLFGALLIAIAIAELRDGSMDTKQIALLGVLAGINAVLRLPGALGGASLMFMLPIVAGYVFGARFGFLLGATSMAASAAITGGIGPWLPFQMWALGWVGAGGGLLRAPLRGRSGALAVGALACFGWFAGYGFGALVNLWFWPFQVGQSALSWSPGIGAVEALQRYWRFYVVTSLAWDSARAIGNLVLIVTLGSPVLRLLERFRARLYVTWRHADPARALASGS